MNHCKKRRAHRYSGLSFDPLDEYHCLIAIWMLRALMRPATFREFFDHKSNRVMNDEIAAFLGMGDMDENMVKPKTVHLLMAQLLKSLEPQKQHERGSLFTNIGHLARRIHLNVGECHILAFAILLKRFDMFDDAIDYVHATTEGRLVSSLSHILDLPADSIRKALSRSSALFTTGLIKMDEGYKKRIDLEPMDGLCDALLATETSEEALLSHFLEPASKPTLKLKDFPHVRKDVELLMEMLPISIERQDKGVNILLYGPPGTGKTELARLLARKANVSLFEVRAEDQEGNPLVPDRRLDAYRFCQKMLASDNRSIILFDEVEDVFPSRSFSFFGMEMKSGEKKGWINRALEENPTPAIWVCNRINQIDPAFLRRFDYAMELNTPPRSVRLNIVRARLENTPVSESFMLRLAEHDELSPAQIAKASLVLKRLACKDQAKAEATLEHVLGNSAKTMGQKPLIHNNRHATHYSLDYLNTNVNITRLLAGLQRSGRGNLCFYGAPGTGKTALGQYIARQLDKPLLTRRASDILSMWVGGSEKNIARMFEQAKSEDAVLLLDEADSLLRDRRGANHSWEVTQVNELLVQMENFDGLFICSTNLMDDLDQASLRRFAIKVEFDYLNPDQTWRMLQQECVGKATDKNRKLISTMRNLAPGDFAAVKKRLAILGVDATADALIAGLKEECAIKDDQPGTDIGFIA